MEQKNVFQNFLKILESQLSVLSDKSEENAHNTLTALWHTASGNRVSAISASKLDLPFLDTSQILLLEDLVNSRISGVPLAYITGRQNFMGIELLSDQRALIPRAETELLGRKALELCHELAREKPNLLVFDVCCGCGNLGLSLANKLPDILVELSDLSEDSVNLSLENIKMLELSDRVQTTQSNLFSSFESERFHGKVDLIVCNPPYISTLKVSKMDIEISSNEPKMAFDGGVIGMKVIQKLIFEAPNFLMKNGYLIFECGLGQGEFLAKRLKSNGNFSKVSEICDEHGNIRVLKARK